MHLQQSKIGRSGGPQYWLQKAPDHILEHIQRHKSCPVILQTSYGPVETSFDAVDPGHKVVRGKIVKANAQHYRVQKGESKESIGEAIRRWFALKSNPDFERIEIEITFDKKSRFILTPIAVKWRNNRTVETLPPTKEPLSFTEQFQSELWKRQIGRTRKENANALDWAASQFKRFVQQYRRPKTKLASEADLLRLAGAFDYIGVRVGPYLLRGYDCPESFFQFLSFPEYRCPIEIKKSSRGFSYQIKNYAHLPRVVVLWLEHNIQHQHEHVDVIEVHALAKYFSL
jgi:hypothetical protein